MGNLSEVQDIITGLNGGTWIFLHQISYGEMIIAILLVLILGVMVFNLVWNAVRSWW